MLRTGYHSSQVICTSAYGDFVSANVTSKSWVRRSKFEEKKNQINGTGVKCVSDDDFL